MITLNSNILSSSKHIKQKKPFILKGLQASKFLGGGAIAVMDAVPSIGRSPGNRVNLQDSLLQRAIGVMDDFIAHRTKSSRLGYHALI